MRFLIIGLGIYGTNLAIDLTDMGHEVIGADVNPARVEAVRDYISAAYIVDSTEESALEVLPFKNVDQVIVAIGENFGASVKTVALLKKLQVRSIYARAIDTIHEAILNGLQVQRILTPEQRAARDLVNEMALGSYVDSLSVGHDSYVLKFEAPELLQGMLYTQLLDHNKYGIKLIAATRPVRTDNILGISSLSHRIIDTEADAGERIEKGDILICFGPDNAYHKLFKSLG